MTIKVFVWKRGQCEPQGDFAGDSLGGGLQSQCPTFTLLGLNTIFDQRKSWITIIWICLKRQAASPIVIVACNLFLGDVRYPLIPQKA